MSSRSEWLKDLLERQERVRQRKAALAAGQREADREDRRYTKKANHVIGTLGGRKLFL